MDKNAKKIERKSISSEKSPQSTNFSDKKKNVQLEKSIKAKDKKIKKLTREVNCFKNEYKKKLNKEKSKILKNNIVGSLTKKVINNSAFNKKLAVLNNEILVYDKKHGYFKLLAETVTDASIMIEQILPTKIVKQAVKKTCLKELISKLFSEIKANKYFICKGNLKLKHNFPHLIPLKGAVLDRYKEKHTVLPYTPTYGFTSYINLSWEKFIKYRVKLHSYQPFLNNFLDQTITDSRSFENLYNLLFAAIINTSKDKLFFIVRCEDEFLRKHFCDMFLRLFDENFKKYFPISKLLEQKNIACLNTSVVNYCELDKNPSATKTELLKALITPKPITITKKSGLSYNYHNRTILLFSSTLENSRFIEQDEFLKGKACFIDLKVADVFDIRKIGIRNYYIKESFIDFLAYGAVKYAKYRNFSALELTTPKQNHKSFIRDFINDCIEFTTNKADRIFFDDVYESYVEYCKKHKEPDIKKSPLLKEMKILKIITKKPSKKMDINDYLGNTYESKPKKNEPDYSERKNDKCLRFVKFKEN